MPYLYAGRKIEGRERMRDGRGIVEEGSHFFHLYIAQRSVTFEGQ